MSSSTTTQATEGSGTLEGGQMSSSTATQATEGSGTLEGGQMSSSTATQATEGSGTLEGGQMSSSTATQATEGWLIGIKLLIYLFDGKAHLCKVHFLCLLQNMCFVHI